MSLRLKKNLKARVFILKSERYLGIFLSLICTHSANYSANKPGIKSCVHFSVNGSAVEGRGGGCAHAEGCLTILQGLLDYMVGHAAGPHGHVGHDVEGVVPGRLQVVNNVARGVVADDDLIFLIVQTCGSHDTLTAT